MPRNKAAARDKKKIKQACKNVESSSNVRTAGFMKGISEKKLSYFLPLYLYFCSLITLSFAHSFFLPLLYPSLLLLLPWYDVIRCSLKSWHSFELPSLEFWRLWVVIAEIFHISERLKLGHQFPCTVWEKIKNARICLLLSLPTAANMRSQSLLLLAEVKCRRQAARGL